MSTIKEFIRGEPLQMRDMWLGLWRNFPAQAPVTVLTFPAESVVMRQGDLSTGVLVMVDGSVSARTDRNRFGTYVFSEFHAPTFFGEQEVLGGLAQWQAEVRTRTPARFLAVQSGDYLNWLEADSEVFTRQVRQLIRTLTTQADRAREALFEPGERRLLDYLAHYAHGHAAPQSVVTVTENREEISAETGLSIRTVTRALTRLEQQQCLTRRHGKITVSPEQLGHIQQLLARV